MLLCTNLARAIDFEGADDVLTVTNGLESPMPTPLLPTGGKSSCRCAQLVYLSHAATTQMKSNALRQIEKIRRMV